MKINKSIFKIGGLVLGMSLFFYFVINASNSIFSRTGKNYLTVNIQDTLKNPDNITEQRIKQIIIVNGKKKIQETVIKMQGDSVIEKKVTETTSNGDEQNDNDGIFGHNFIFQDSMIGTDVHNFSFGVEPIDSMMKSFRFKFDSPQFNFNFGDDIEGFPDDFKNYFKNKDPQENSSPFRQDMDEFMQKFFKNYNFSQEELPSHGGFGENNNNKPLTISEIVKNNLLDDGIIKDSDQKYKFEINEKGLKIDGKKQDQDLYKKYKKLIEDSTGVALKDNFSFVFTNDKKLKAKSQKI